MPNWIVMVGFRPTIHVFFRRMRHSVPPNKSWMVATSATMTIEGVAVPMRYGKHHSGYVELEKPPSTTTISPVTKGLCSTSASIDWATSSAVTQRLSGVCLARASMKRS